MELFSDLIKTHGGPLKQQTQHFRHFSQQLKSPKYVEQLMDRMTDRTLKGAVIDYERYNIVREMIAIKYGAHQPVTSELLVEVSGRPLGWGGARSPAGRLFPISFSGLVLP